MGAAEHHVSSEPKQSAAAVCCFINKDNQDEQCFVASHCASICRYLFAVINHLSACFDAEGRIALCYCPFPLAASHRQQLLLHCFCCAWLLLHLLLPPITLLATCRVAYALSSS